MAKTLLLDLTNWDLVVDVNGNIAVASDPYSLAQDAASAIKLFSGELWYDTTQGIPYFQTTLGKFPSLALLKQQFVAAVVPSPGVTGVPGVVAARCFITGVSGRRLSGQVQTTDAAGNVAAVGF